MYGTWNLTEAPARIATGLSGEWDGVVEEQEIMVSSTMASEALSKQRVIWWAAAGYARESQLTQPSEWTTFPMEKRSFLHFNLKNIKATLLLSVIVADWRTESLLLLNFLANHKIKEVSAGTKIK